MRNRFLLLAGTVLPFALIHPAIALDRTAAPIVLAQTEAPAEPCPEGQECPPPAEACPEGQECPPPPAAQPPAEEPPPAPEQPAPEQPAPEAPAPEQPAAEQPAPEQPAAEQPAPEQPAAEQPAPEQPAAEQPAQPAAEQPAPEQPAAEQPAPEQPAAAAPAPEQPAAAEQPAEGGAVERARRRQQQLQQQGTGEQQPAAQQPAQDQAATPPPVEQQSVVEQQLEAQGDQEQADKVRTLRDQLLDQLLQAVTPQPQQQDQGQGNRRADRRDRDRRHGGSDSLYDRDETRGEVVDERGGRIVIDLGGGNIYVEPIVPDEGERLLYGADDVEVQNLPHGRTRTIVHRPNGVDIVTVRDRFGNIVKRSKFLPNGREIVLIDNRYADNDNAPPPPILHDVPPPRVRIPRDRYIVDLGRASDDDIRYALQAPLVQEPPRAYTLDEVLRNQDVRAYSPRIDLDTITFDFGSATIGDGQMGALYELGQVMEEVIADNPDEVYLVEGHTDAVGSDYDNLILSDERAEAVATALSQNFDIPPENLVTEGYGEQFLKVDTQGADRRNRRATVRRLTELLQAEAQ